MQRLAVALCAAIFTVATIGAIADAKPAVVLKLSGSLVERASNGAEKSTPVESSQLKPGDIVRYTIVASNAGSDPARNFVSIGQVPAGTVFAAGTATARDGARVEYSIDGGKNWSAAPTVHVHTAAGDVVKKADPATYTSVRWISEKPLAAKASATFAYAVRVK